MGCNATACILALLPLVQANLLDPAQPVICEIKVGSSEGGAEGNPGSHHPERSGVIRTFSAFGHRHTAEVLQELGLADVAPDDDLGRPGARRAGQHPRTGARRHPIERPVEGLPAGGQDNPFLRLVKERRGIYRVPEPKILAGSNYADLGFELDESNGHLVSICAIDNLMKGAAGSAVQCLNLMQGLPETLGLEFMGLHPI